MADDLTTAAVEALRNAAERLGVDAYRLARFLADGRLGDILESLGRTGSPAENVRRFELAEEYLRFLDDEIERQEDRRPVHGRTNGA